MTTNKQPTTEPTMTEENTPVAEPFVPQDPPVNELPPAEWPAIDHAADSAGAVIAEAVAQGPAMQYALIKSGIVENVIVASAEFAKLIAPEWDHIEAIDTAHELELHVGIGWGFKDGEFIKPPEPPKPAPLPPVRELPAGALYLRFSFAERAGIMLAGTINPAADIKTQQLQAQVATLRSDLMSARTISLDSPGLLTGCKLLASLKILSDDWEDRILKAKVTPAEQNFGG